MYHGIFFRPNFFFFFIRLLIDSSLLVQWLRIHLPNAGDTGSIPGPGRLHMLLSS